MKIGLWLEAVLIGIVTVIAIVQAAISVLNVL